jgi:hypothetical protein
MEYPRDRVALICGLSAFDAKELLAKARAGDAQALGDWTVWAVYSQLRNEVHLNHIRALNHTANMFSLVDLRPVIVP